MKHLRLLLAVALASLPVRAAGQDLVISELMATSSGAYRDDDGDVSDWFEIYNASASPIDLDGHFVTDELRVPTKWRLPAVTLDAGRFLLVWASGKNRVDPDAALHANFRLDRLGEYLALVAPDGVTTLHEFFPAYPAQVEGFSYGLPQNASSETLIREGAPARAMVPSNGALGFAWTQRGFDDSGWKSGATGVGYDRNTDYRPLIRLDVSAEMENVRTSCFVRVGFTLSDAQSVSRLVLRMKYDDGFIASINGERVADRNAPATASWDASATGLHDDSAALVFEEIDISQHVRALRDGQNVLAIHGLNDNIGSSDFLLVPELLAVRAGELQPDAVEFFSTPTPGGVNVPGFPGVADRPVLSRASGVFGSTFALGMSIPTPGQQVRYTTDGSEPTTSSPLYTGPISINRTMMVRARGFAAGFAPSAVVTASFVRIASNLLTRSSNLPLMVIDTFGAGIGQDPWVPSLTAVVDVDDATRRSRLDGPYDFVGSTAIKTRGSSSLGFPKKNYALEVRDGRGQDRDVSILDMPSESDWILHGPYSDKSLMRNHLSYLWSNWIGRYAVRTEFVELYLNTGGGDVSTSDYLGVYVFMEKIKRDPDRVDIERLTASARSEPQISGGYILKKDRPDPGDTGFRTSRGTELRYVYPKEDEITPAQAAWIRGYLDDFEAALWGSRFKDPDVGYARYIDVGSFIDHHILVELTKNIDGYRLSTFMFKDRDGKLNMGPIWDYNLSLRNANYLEGWLSRGWYYPLLSSSDYPWYPRLFQDEDFAQAYQDRWAQLRARELLTPVLMASIDDATALLRESAARNFSRWNILGTYVWPNPNPLATTFEQEVNLMKSWLDDRLRWWDGLYRSPPRFSHPGGPIEPGFGLTMTSTSGSIYYTVDGSDPRLPGGAISPRATRYSAAVTLTENTRVIARSHASRTQWSAPTAATFVTRTPPLVITELMYHPADDPDAADGLDPDDLEFIELSNVGGETMELAGFRLIDGVEFDFDESSVERLAPGDHVVVVSDLAAFSARYDTRGIKIAGEYRGRLENRIGEIIELVGPLEEPILRFAYDETWYPETDGGGRSLVIVDPLGPLDSWGERSSWRPGDVDGGTPGIADSDVVAGGWQRPGDSNGDGLTDISDAVSILRRLFVDPSMPLPCEGAIDEGGNLHVLDINDDARVDVSDAITLLEYLFKDRSAPTRGEECRRLEGCRDSCVP